MIKDIRAPLRNFLLSDPDISTMVGGSRIFPLVLPQGERGASIVYSRISGRGDHHMEGSSGLVMLRMQIDAWAPSADTATALANAVKTRLDGYRGTMMSSGSPVEIVDVQGVFYETEREDYQSDIEMYRVSRDYFFWYGEL